MSNGSMGYSVVQILQMWSPQSKYEYMYKLNLYYTLSKYEYMYKLNLSLYQGELGNSFAKVGSGPMNLADWDLPSLNMTFEMDTEPLTCQ